MARVALAFAVLLSGGTTAHAQQIRVNVSNLARYVEARPIRRDTVDVSLTDVDEAGRRTFDGRPVFCSAQTCTWYRPGDVEYAVAMAQDVSIAAWSTSIEGLSGNLYLRTRQALAGDFTWPRSDDAFDAVLAYAELAREQYRLRLGRQRSLNGLGFYSYDGISGWYNARDWLSVEAYGGRSLARALEEPRREALGAIENFIPDNEAWLIGVAAELQSSNDITGTIRYQREIWGDRAALVSERASVDIRSDLLGWVDVEAAADYDVAYNQLGKAHITVRRALGQNLSIDLTLQRYLPFFELWTIWGVFSPVPYHEVEIQAGWRALPNLSIDARAGVRRYRDADAAVFIAPAEDESKRLALHARATLPGDFTVDAEYQLERGFGAFLSSGEIAVQREQSDRLRAGIYATAFQQILEFRTGEAVVYGLGLNSSFQIMPNLELTADAAIYHQAFDNRPSAVNWNQKRGSLGIVWNFGRDPGVGK